MRCAHNPPPCHFIANLQLSIFVFNIFLRRVVTKCRKKVRTSSSLQCFFIILDVRIVIFSTVGGSRQPLEPILRILGIVVILMARPVRKPTRSFGQNAAIDALFWSCVFYVFWSFFGGMFVILSARRLRCRCYFYFFLGAPGPRKNS